MKIFNDFNTFVKIEPVNKGWSKDKKYYAETDDGRKLLLRVSDAHEFEYRKTEFEMMKKVSKLGIPMCMPLDFGTCEDGVYSIHTWIDGKDAKVDGVVLPGFSEPEKYMYGLKAGEILRKIHSLPAPENHGSRENQEKWDVLFDRTVDNKVDNYLRCGLRFEGDEYILNYIANNRHLLKLLRSLGKRPQCFRHGDYHPGNMMIENGGLTIIDFNRYSFGDPWEDFNCLEWDAPLSPHFATGQLRGYFGGRPPLEFFMMLKFYISCNILTYIHGAAVGLNDFDTMMNQARDVLDCFDNMKNPIPTWYLRDL